MHGDATMCHTRRKRGGVAVPVSRHRGVGRPVARRVHAHRSPPEQLVQYYVASTVAVRARSSCCTIPPATRAVRTRRAKAGRGAAPGTRRVSRRPLDDADRAPPPPFHVKSEGRLASSVRRGRAAAHHGRFISARTGARAAQSVGGRWAVASPRGRMPARPPRQPGRPAGGWGFPAYVHVRLAACRAGAMRGAHGACGQTSPLARRRVGYMPACTRTGRPRRRTPRLCWQRRVIPARRRIRHSSAPASHYLGRDGR